MEQILNTSEASSYLKLAKATLEAWRTRGGGPVFLKLGKAVRYRQSDLDSFLQSRTFDNTSQAAG